MPSVYYMTQDDERDIKDLLLGRRVEKVSDESLLLDDGTSLKLRGNVGGCCCGAGDYYLTELNGCDNIITSVEMDNAPYEDDYGEGVYTIFVFAENERITLASFEGSDGNGYYGTGYYIKVQRP